ncbi:MULTISPECIES: FAD-dependent oxidoreductase [Saccharothrix]|uniref:FAD-dependent oxidoreductase n=1 Tax=Saccharothrix TaxID=2071 RepID=UPI001F527324|nr:FAD-dependent monooxygenase [Saccharothrix sp. CB00851]
MSVSSCSQLDARGLVEEVDRTGVGRVTDIRLFERVHVDLGRLPSRFPYMLITPQYNVERALLARAVEAGARIVYDAAVTAVRQDATGAEVDTAGGTYRADYVVGTDGFHSAVRQALGQPFPGKSVLKSIMLADVRLRETPGTALRVPAVHRKLTGRLTALGFRYRHAAGEHRLTGTRMPDAPLADGTRLSEALRGGRFVLVGTGDVTGWEDRVRVTAPAAPGADTVLVRPDGHVAKVFTGTPDPAALRDTLTALAGTPVAE